VPVVPILGVLCCLGLMATLPGDTWIRLFRLDGDGLVVYFLYAVAIARWVRHGQPEVRALSPRGAVMERRSGGRDVPSQDASLRRAHAVGGGLTFWTASASRSPLRYSSPGALGPALRTWGQAIRIQPPGLVRVGLFALLVARLKQRVPIERDELGVNFAFHVSRACS